MAKITATVDPSAQSGEMTKEQVLQEANNATNPNVIPSAQTVRDAQGKVVQIIVGLPDSVAAADLETARAAIDSNAGIATGTAIAVPISLTNGAESFEDEADGQPVEDMGDIGSDYYLVKSFSGDPANDKAIASNEEASDGLLSLRMKADNSDMIQASGNVSLVTVSDWALSNASIGYDAMHSKMKVFLGKAFDITGGLPGTEFNPAVSPFVGPENAFKSEDLFLRTGKARFVFRSGLNTGGAGAKLTYEIGTGPSFQSQEFTLAIPRDEFVTIEQTYDGRNGTATATLTTSGGSETLTFTGLSNLEILTRQGDEFFWRYSAGAGGTDPDAFINPALPGGTKILQKCYIDEVEIDILNIAYA